MLQYCVLYAKIQKLNMSNRMNKTNSDNEVYEETDLRTGQCKTLNHVEFNLSVQMFFSGLNGSKLYSTKDKLEWLGPRRYFRQWCNESTPCNC